jgi:hypothetical protein
MAITVSKGGIGGASLFVGLKLGKEGLPVRFAQPGEEEAGIIKLVNDFDTYKFSSQGLGAKVGISAPRARALAAHLGMLNNPAYFKKVKMPDGKSYGRYTDAAVDLSRDQLPKVDIDGFGESITQKVASRFRQPREHLAASVDRCAGISEESVSRAGGAPRESTRPARGNPLTAGCESESSFASGILGGHPSPNRASLISDCYGRSRGGQHSK